MSQVINYNGQLINLNGSVIANKFPIRDGLVFYLDGGVDKCYAGTGTTATDLSVSSVSTSLNNGVGFSEDNKGYFSFDGVNDYMRTSGGAVSMGHTQQRTTCAWIRLDDYNSSTKVMVEHTTNFNSNTGAFVLIHSEYGLDGSLQQSIRGPGIYNIAWTDDPYDSNTWYFWCATYDASLGALDCQQHYINGEQVDFTHHGTHRKDLNDYGIDNQDLYFNSRAGTNYFSNHDLGAFYLYDRVLSQDEIRAIYNHQKQRFEHIITDGLVLDLDATNLFSYPGTGTTWSDLSPSGNDATLINGPTFQSDPPALVFDGVDDYGTVYDTSTVFQDNDPWTAIVAYRINDTGITGTNGLITSQKYISEQDPGGWGIVCQTFSNNTNRFQIHLTYDNGVDTPTHQTVYNSVTNVPHQEWSILAFSYNPDTSSIKGYSNGVLQTTTAATQEWTVNKTSRFAQLHMATQGGYNGIDYSASFGEVQVYKRTLSDDEIEYNFNARRGRYGI